VISTDISVWLGAFWTVAILSYPLYKDTILYQFAERSLVSATAGYLITLAIRQVVDLTINPVLQEGQYMNLLPLVIGLLLFARFFQAREAQLLSRWSIAIFMGISLSVAIIGNITGKAVALIAATMVAPTSFDNILVIIIVITGLVYFLFSVQHTGVVGQLARLGRYLIMITFGVNFGNYALTRLTLILNRLMFLLYDLLGLG
jgi:hypothetical protein